jgi:hypothetical protein
VDGRAGGGDKLVSVRETVGERERRDRLRVVVRGESVDLFDVEDGVALHEGNFTRNVLAVAVSFDLGDAIGIDYKRPMFALADLRTHLPGLFIGHPERGGVALGESLGPEQQHVDATVGYGIVTKRASDAPGDMFDAPRFHPGSHAVFKLEHYLVRDAGVEILSA